MLTKGKSMLIADLDSRAICKASSSRAVRLGTFGVVLAAVALVGFASSALAADDAGETAFKSNCVICHAADGSGTPTGKALKAPDLRSDAVQKMTDAQIEDQITNGKNNMPPFKNTLNKDQIKALATYVHTLGKKH
jgi:mono/diheme cytochrome c family protein